MEFLSQFDQLEENDLRLCIRKKNPGNDKEIPYYWYDIILKATNEVIGQISLRIGKNFHSYYNGNIGYYIEKQHRGHNYAYAAVQMLYPVSLAHHQRELLLTCDEDNISSYKTIQKLGGILLETVQPPRDYFAYYEGMPKEHIFLLKIK